MRQGFQGAHSIVVESDNLTVMKLLRVEKVNLTVVRSLVENILEVIKYRCQRATILVY